MTLICTKFTNHLLTILLSWLINTAPIGSLSLHLLWLQREWWCQSLRRDFIKLRKHLVRSCRPIPCLWAIQHTNSQAGFCLVLPQSGEDTRISLNWALEWASYSESSRGATSKQQPQTKSPWSEQTGSPPSKLPTETSHSAVRFVPKAVQFLKLGYLHVYPPP